MTDPTREDWPRLIAELEAAGISRYKLAQMLKPACQLHQVSRWASRELWENGTEPSHWLGEQIRSIHTTFHVKQ